MTVFKLEKCNPYHNTFFVEAFAGRRVSVELYSLVSRVACVCSLVFLYQLYCQKIYSNLCVHSVYTAVVPAGMRIKNLFFSPIDY